MSRLFTDSEVAVLKSIRQVEFKDTEIGKLTAEVEHWKNKYKLQEHAYKEQTKLIKRDKAIVEYTLKLDNIKRTLHRLHREINEKFPELMER